MKATKTQAQVYSVLQKFGSDMVIPQPLPAGSTVTLKGMYIENAGDLPTGYQMDYKQMPKGDEVFFLVGIPKEAKRDEQNRPINSTTGAWLTPQEYPMPNLTREEWVYEVLKQDRSFTVSGRKFTNKKPVPLLIANVPLYILFVCKKG